MPGGVGCGGGDEGVSIGTRCKEGGVGGRGGELSPGGRGGGELGVGMSWLEVVFIGKAQTPPDFCTNPLSTSIYPVVPLRVRVIISTLADPG